MRVNADVNRHAFQMLPGCAPKHRRRPVTNNLHQAQLSDPVHVHRAWSAFWLGGCVSPEAGAAVAASGADGCPALVRVEVVDVDGGDLAGPGGGLMQYPPPRLSPRRDVAAGQQPFDPGP